MKKNVWVKMMLVLVLFLSLLMGNTVQAEGVSSLSEGEYQVGKDIPAGLTKFSVSKGMANIYVMRGINDLVWETLDSENVYYPNQVTVKLKTGDRIEVYPESAGSTIQIGSVSKVDLKNMSAGLYEIGAEIPAGTYLLDVDHAKNSVYDMYIYVYDERNEYVEGIELHPADAPFEYKFAAGQKVYVTELAGTMSFTKKVIVPTSLKLNKSSLAITPSQAYKVTATVSPSNAVNKTVVWKSSNTKVATVDAAGNIKGIAGGSATITATAKDNAKAVKTLTVKVSAKTVKLNKTALSLTAGKTSVLTATVSPADSTYKTVTWKSSNAKVAAVDSKGKVTAKAKGTATITAAVKSAKTATVKVTVTSPVAAKSVKMSKSSATLTKGKTLALSAAVSPSNTTNKALKWKSSNIKVAKVDSKGKVTAVAAGAAKITATTTNGKTTTATITVPYSKTLSSGTWKGGTHLPAGRYKITTTSDFGNLFITMSSYDRYINEILAKDPADGVTTVTTDIKAGDKIQIMGLDSVQFTKVASRVKSNTLSAGYWTVGTDISAGRYRITTTDYMGNLFVQRGSSSIVNEILSAKPDAYTVTSVTATLKTGDRIQISGMNKVIFTKK
ncbi:Ig-like domain-containing protein [Planococcus shenhongbingii]|uniref:Ig-like domain-containing protein n=1 Tax=Planococcus shenhongbingii TaxID=3058398 RepID=UPI00263551DF|nr:Ig-like domain-containing protein [Planococcus sp. N016]WKA57788.1 Ig-like domain-containing protein [Planococcus sp. N016]